MTTMSHLDEKRRDDNLEITVARWPGSIAPLSDRRNSGAGAAFPETQEFGLRGRNAMKSKTVVEGQERTFVLILDSGEEAFKSISQFA